MPLWRELRRHSLPMLAFACLGISMTGPVSAQAGGKDELAVSVENKSEPTLCAEKDNVYLSVASREVKSFRIEAVHPNYIGTIVSDRWAPDWTNCETLSVGDPVFPSTPRRKTVWENFDWWLVGHNYSGFWRDAKVPLKLRGSEERFHLIQLWTWVGERAEEVLVVYPPDGYWRARPLPPDHLRWTAYGTSFLVGPVEMQKRPIVDLKEIEFDPDTITFTARFTRGGAAKLKLVKLDKERLTLDVTFEGDVPRDVPLAALRSMFVSPVNNDVEQVMWREPGQEIWKNQGVMNFRSSLAQELWAGRTVASRHNTSAPDMHLSRFSKDDAPQTPVVKQGK